MTVKHGIAVLTIALDELMAEQVRLHDLWTDATADKLEATAARVAGRFDAQAAQRQGIEEALAVLRTHLDREKPP